MSLNPLLEELDARIIVRQDVLSILIVSMKLLELLAIGGRGRCSAISIDIAVQIRRRGHELKLVYAAPEARPVELSARSLLRVAELPITWPEQRRVLGFD
jgi:hypothetical protein